MKICARPTTQLRCPFCHDSVEVADARICPACSSAQHPACDLAHGGCAVCVVHTPRVRLSLRLRGRSQQGSRRRRGSLGRAMWYGSAALALLLVAIVAACWAEASVGPPFFYPYEPSRPPSKFTFRAILVCLVSGAGSLFCLATSLRALGTRHAEAARDFADLVPSERRRAWTGLLQANALNLLAWSLALAAAWVGIAGVMDHELPLVAISLASIAGAGSLALWARRIQRKVKLWAASHALTISEARGRAPERRRGGEDRAEPPSGT